MASKDAGIDIVSIEMESALSSKSQDGKLNVKHAIIDDEGTQNDKEKPSTAGGKAFNDMPGDTVLSSRSTATASVSRYSKNPDRERKIGHRRVGEGGEITYKKIQTTTLMGSIQLGIQHTVGSLASKPKRDLLMMDFWEMETISFPPEGSSITPAHHYSEFRFKIYAPIAFRYFRDLFGIQPDDFMMSMCSCPLRELSNPGASGSIFYLTEDDEFIIKTVQHKEGEFLQKLLPGYYMNLNQNPRTLLPKFFGLYCYQCNSKNVRLIVMNNLLPSYVKMHLKYDLKGSTYKRKANKTERGKRSPTYKDLDFIEHHPNGIFLEADTYNALIKTIQRDCRVLESFKIMDYSLLVGVHNLDIAFKEKQEEKTNQPTGSSSGQANPQHQMPSTSLRDDDSDLEDAPEADQFIAHERDREERERGATALNRSRSINRQRLVAHSTAMESIQAESEPIDEEEDVPPGGIPARSEKGERLLLFIGIIDILQSYRLKKKLEHTIKSIIHDGETVSVCRPSFYAQRFQDFMAKTVFKKIPSPLKHSPSKRKSLSRAAQRSTEADSDSHPVAGSSQQQHHHHHHHHHQTANTNNNNNNNNNTNSNINSNSNNNNNNNSNNSILNSTIKSSSDKISMTTAPPFQSSTTTSKPVVTTAPSQSNMVPSSSASSSTSAAGTGINTIGTLPQIGSKKSGFAKQKVPPPVPPRGSPKTRRGGGQQQQQQKQHKGATVTPRGGTPSSTGTAPSCCSTPPPAFDDISEHGGSSSHHHHHHHHHHHNHNNNQRGSLTGSGYPLDEQRRVHSSGSGGSAGSGSGGSTIRSTTYREDTVSISEIRLDSHLAVDSTSGSQYGSRGALAWTPPASVEGSTPTWTEGTPSFTESSSSGDMGFSGNSSPLNTSATDRHKPTVEEALNSLTSEMPILSTTASTPTVKATYTLPNRNTNDDNRNNINNNSNNNNRNSTTNATSTTTSTTTTTTSTATTSTNNNNSFFNFSFLNFFGFAKRHKEI